MSSADELLAEMYAGQTSVEVLIGTFVQQAGAMAVVDVGTARVTMPSLGQYFPVPSDPVRVLRIDKLTFLLGPAQPKSPIGRVTAAGSPRCTVEYPSGSGVTKLMGYPSNITPAVNDIVLIDWSSGGTISDKITAAPIVTVPTDPTQGGGPTQGRQVFTAIDSGTFYVPGSRWNTNEVWAVTTGNNLGAWFYGSKIKDTIPDGATIVSASIYLPLFFDQGSAPVARVHGSAAKPGGNVAPSGATHTLSPRSGWAALPTAFLDVLKSADGGIALVNGGWAKYSGTGSDGQSGALDVTWTS